MTHIFKQLLTYPAMKNRLQNDKDQKMNEDAKRRLYLEN